MGNVRPLGYLRKSTQPAPGIHVWKSATSRLTACTDGLEGMLSAHRNMVRYHSVTKNPCEIKWLIFADLCLLRICYDFCLFISIYYINLGAL